MTVMIRYFVTTALVASLPSANCFNYKHEDRYVRNVPHDYVFFPHEVFTTHDHKNIILTNYTQCEQCNFLDELPRVELNALNKISRQDDFADLFKLPIPQSHPVTLAKTDVDFVGRTGVTVPNVLGNTIPEEATHAACQPELTTVKLSLNQSRHHVYYPDCVRLPRCGGCCYGSALSCQPTKVEKVALQIMKVRTSKLATGSNKRRRVHRLRARNTSSKEYEIVEEVKHVECDCLCITQKKDCDPEVHVYVQDDCLCKCKNRKKEEKCHYRSHTHVWDSKTCRCLCKDESECSTGEYFNHNSCSCIRKELKPSLPPRQ